MTSRRLRENYSKAWYQSKTGLIYTFRSLNRCRVPQHCGETWIKWHSVLTVKSYFKWMRLCNKLLFSPSCWANMFFSAPAVLLKFTLLYISIFKGILPETQYLLRAFISILGKFWTLYYLWDPVGSPDFSILVNFCLKVAPFWILAHKGLDM